MRKFCCTDDRINRAGVNTQRAADALAFINFGNCGWLMLTERRVERAVRLAEQIGQGGNGRCSARRALIDFRVPVKQGLGVGQATWVAALAALGLRQQAIDLVQGRSLTVGHVQCDDRERRSDDRCDACYYQNGCEHISRQTSRQSP